MATIGSDQLIHAIEQGRSIAPLGIDEDLVDAMIEDIQAQQLTLDSDDDLSVTVRQYVKPYLNFLRPERRRCLEHHDLFVLPYERCVAFSQPGPKGRGQIVVSAGMINLMTSSICDAALQNRVPKPLAACDLILYRQNLLFVLNATTFLLRYRYYRYGEPLPSFERALDDQAKENCRTAVQGALLFMLMHEVGHLELGHHDNHQARLWRYDTVVEQTLSDYQIQEAEADEFALKSLTDEAMQVGSYWMSQSLVFFVTLELFSGEMTDTHPLAINRHHVSEALRHNPAIHRPVIPPPKVSAVLGKRFEVLANSNPALTNVSLLETPRPALANALVEAVLFLHDNGVDLRDVLPSVIDTTA